MIPNQTETSDTADISSAKSDFDDEEALEEPERGDERKIFTPDHLVKLFIFALTWGMGAYLESQDRLKYDVFMKENMCELGLPQNTSKYPEVSILLGNP